MATLSQDVQLSYRSSNAIPAEHQSALTTQPIIMCAVPGTVAQWFRLTNK